MISTADRPAANDLTWCNDVLVLFEKFMSESSILSTPPETAHFTALPEFSEGVLGAWLTGFVRSSDRGVLIVASDHRIVLVNGAAGQIFGRHGTDLLGQAIDTLLPYRTRSASMAQLERFTAMRVAGRRLRIKLDLKGRRANGDEFYLGVSLSRLAVKGDVFLVVIAQELTPQQSRPSPSFRLRKLAGSSQQANESERRHFSRALYDDIGQRLSVMKLDLDWCQGQPAEANLSRRLQQIQLMLDDIILNTKIIASGLRPPLLDDFGLLAAVEWLGSQFQKRTGIACSLRCTGASLGVNEIVDSAVFRIVEEALTNIELHANARHVDISLWRTEHDVHVVVADDGTGLHESWRNKPGCLGLMAMDERIGILGGRVHIKNLDPSGVAILASLPVDSRPRPIATS